MPSLTHGDHPSQSDLQAGRLLWQTFPWAGSGGVETEEIRYCHVGGAS